MDKSYYILVVIVAMAIGLIISVDAFLLLPIQPPMTVGNAAVSQTPVVNITLYAGEISDSLYGFGSEPNRLTSPGPTLRLQTAVTVNLTIVNVGTKAHAFQITNAPRTGALVLFEATIGTADNPLQPGESGSVVFFPNIPNNSFFYICPVSDDAKMGMWGTVVVD